MLYGIFKDNPKDTIMPIDERTGKRHNWQNRYLSHWKKTGLQPIFIVSDGRVDNCYQFEEIAKTTDYTNSCHGSATINGVAMDYLYWIGETPSHTPGIFNFPLSETTTFTPYRAGYQFSPKQIKVEQGDENESIHFESKPLALTDHLQLELNFNKKTLKNKEFKAINNCGVMEDKHRGEVLQINSHGYIELGNTQDYNIKDNSFTIAFWLLMPDTLQGKCSIFGTNVNNFREGLHLQLRNYAPYFGFFINDIWSKHKISHQNWHHFVFSYDKVCREKRIYIDGAISDMAQESPSFIGDGNLFIGKCINEENEHPFYMDNLIIWSRALNENEVKGLQTEDSMQLANIQLTKMRYLLLMGGGVLLFLVTSIGFQLKRNKKKRQKPIPIRKTEQQRNALFLYGNFSLFDRDGEDIASTMSPLIKELFLKLLMSSLQGRKGESTKNLTEQFWGDMSAPQARNSRNVALVRLRKFLENVPGLSIEYLDGKHCVQIDDELFVDFIQAKQYQLAFPEDEIVLYLELVSRGGFLHNLKYDWLERFQEEKNQEVIEFLLLAIQNPEIKSTDYLTEQICLHILKLDDLNEEALRYLLNLYHKQGKTALMSKLYTDFSNTYTKAYNEGFKYKLHELISNNATHIQERKE